MNRFELHPERLSTTDEKGYRVYLYPADVKGFFRRWRNWVQFILILIFLSLPWVQIGGKQALLLDVSRRHFEIFGLTLKAHNAPLLFFVLAAIGFGLFFVTAVWGRVWCGWACPQTVFIDGVFRRIERLVEGSANERRQLDASPISFKKVLKRSIKWTLFIIASLIITHSFLAYFVGTDALQEMVTRSPSENWASFVFIAFSTGIILFDFAWFREQFCIIACPYGRFQSVLMDEHSMIVTYDHRRGEPRATPQAKVLAKNHHTQLGDCVNCYRCVQVCPTGIDIRRGLQMECIACTSCVDACDEVMTKLNKPTGLIRYDSQIGLQNQKPRRIRVRTVLYASIVIVALSALITILTLMKPVDIAVLRAKESPYQVQTGPQGEVVMNHLKIELSNQSGELRNLSFDLDPSLINEGFQLITALRPFPLKVDAVTRADIFIRFPKTALSNGVRKINLTIKDKSSSSDEEEVVIKEATLVGPFN